MLRTLQLPHNGGQHSLTTQLIKCAPALNHRQTSTGMPLGILNGRKRNIQKNTSVAWAVRWQLCQIKRDCANHKPKLAGRKTEPNNQTDNKENLDLVHVAYQWGC